MEFFEDYYTKNPGEAHQLGADFISVGDTLVDKWEREVAKGIVPDLTEGLEKTKIEELIQWSSKAYERYNLQRGILGMPDKISEKYGR